MINVRTKGLISNHSRRHGHCEVMRLQCDQCSFQTDSNFDMNYHILSHADRPFKCRKCLFSVVKKAHLVVHQRFGHFLKGKEFMVKNPKLSTDSPFHHKHLPF